MPRVNFYIGSDSFREIREEDKYYVDKTAFIEELLLGIKAKVFLFTRPRRFGKTLNMTMLREFFDVKAENKNLFEGLAISKNKELCSKWQNQYPVVYLTLKECIGINFKKISDRFADMIREICLIYPELQQDVKVGETVQEVLNKLEKDFDRSLLPASLKIISQALYSHYNKKIILLIDEYDVPINNAYHYGFYEEMIMFIRNFLGSVLKGNEFLEFAVLTGCLRISTESIFTGLNNFKCFGISDVAFSDSFGFTSEEVNNILAEGGLEDKKPLIKDWYDGYTFGKNAEIYCPWDVINYVADLQTDSELQPKLYWNNTSGNSIIKDFLIQKDFDIKEKIESLLRGGCVEVTLADQQTYGLLYSSEENFWNILYLTGYLTKATDEQIRNYGKKVDESKMLLAIPNKEVRSIYETVIREWIPENMDKEEKRAFLAAFWNGDAEQVASILTRQLRSSISFNDYAEKFYHAVLLGVFLFSGNGVSSNLEAGEGRSDLFIKNVKEDKAAVIEVKYAKKLEELPRFCEEALEQISEKNYDYNLREDYDTIFHWGIAFYKKRCAVKAIKREHCLRMA